MPRPGRTTLAAALVALVAAPGPGAGAESGSAAAPEGWRQWRGPLATGVAPGAEPPVEWSETKNIRWKAGLPGKGHSTPVVSGELVLVTAAEPFGERLEPRPETAPGAHDNVPVTHRHRFLALALSRKDGRVVWQRTLREDLPHEGGHYSGSYASASPATDGERLFAFFGSRGLYALDLEGEVRWKKEFGPMQTLHGHGEGSSPALHAETDTLVVNWDHEGGSFVTAIDTRSGRERWRVARDEPTSWASPIVIEVAGKPQAVVSGTNRIRGYDLASGAVVWECGGLSDNVVASPVAAAGRVIAGSSYDRQAMVALRIDGEARGDLTGGERVLWRRTRGTPYVPSPLLYGDTLYFLHHYQGILICLDPATGEEKRGPVRLRGIRNVYASPVGAAGRVYVTDQSGTTEVLAVDEDLRLLARNRLDGTFCASAALAGRELYLRSDDHLYCIAED